MGRIAIMGDPVRIQGWAMAGVLLAPVPDDGDVRAAWASLPADVDLVLITERVAAALGDDNSRCPVAVLP